MQDDSNYDALQKLYNDRNTKDSNDFSTLSDNSDQEEVYGQMLREVDTHEFDDEENK